MKSIKFFLPIFIIGLFFGGCCNKQLTGCDHPSGWCNEIRDLSIHSWKYAQLSKNVYKKKFQYNVENFFKELNNFENTELDFYATLYEDKIDKKLILVIRGTDSVKDIITGNNPLKPNSKQNQYGLKVYDDIQSNFGRKIDIVAGHSLGGGIAIHISLNRDNVTAYSFNGSPIFKNKNNKENTRYSIVEYGEILKFPRIFGKEATQLYTSIGCSEGNPLGQHDIKKLADCLTQIAAIESLEAHKSLVINKIENKYNHSK